MSKKPFLISIYPGAVVGWVIANKSGSYINGGIIDTGPGPKKAKNNGMVALDYRPFNFQLKLNKILSQYKPQDLCFLNIAVGKAESTNVAYFTSLASQLPMLIIANGLNRDIGLCSYRYTCRHATESKDIPNGLQSLSDKQVQMYMKVATGEDLSPPAAWALATARYYINFRLGVSE